MDIPGQGTAPASPAASRRDFSVLVLAALGVVYGDIGTSPLYAIRECFNADHGVPLTVDNVFGILSLVFWSLTLVVLVKYLYVVLYADNRGEGGIMALMSLALASGPDGRGLRKRSVIILLGLCGTALLVADGMITPSISVLSAVEGLQVAAPIHGDAILAITVAILVALFLVQRHGTTRIGSVFGPVMLVWFAALAALGLRWIMREPGVLAALDPRFAVRFFLANGWTGLIVLGAVVLCVTGCEALYADLGHFGRRPIAFAWQAIVFPAVLINYFGQGAALISRGDEILANPFFSLAPAWMLVPMVLLATAATVIASQALISGTFSLARQAMQLDYLPRLTVLHTSEKMHGQIYIPEINTGLAIACVALVIGFRTSSNLAAAYGIAVVGTMAITSLLMFAVERGAWGWRWWQAASLTALLLAMDGFFLVGNLVKVLHGGWFPLAAGVLMLVMLRTWNQGNAIMTSQAMEAAIPLSDFIRTLKRDTIPRVRGTAAFLMTYPDITPRVLLHHLKHNKVLHEHVMLMSVVVEGVPVVEPIRRLSFEDLDNGFHKVTVRAGFMQNIDIREILRLAADAGINTDTEVTYYIGHVTLRTTGRTRMRQWRKELFAFLFNNERSRTVLLGIPPNRVVELGEQTQL